MRMLESLFLVRACAHACVCTALGAFSRCLNDNDNLLVLLQGKLHKQKFQTLSVWLMKIFTSPVSHHLLADLHDCEPGLGYSDKY